MFEILVQLVHDSDNSDPPTKLKFSEALNGDLVLIETDRPERVMSAKKKDLKKVLRLLTEDSE